MKNTLLTSKSEYYIQILKLIREKGLYEGLNWITQSLEESHTYFSNGHFLIDLEGNLLNERKTQLFLEENKNILIEDKYLSNEKIKLYKLTEEHKSEGQNLIMTCNEFNELIGIVRLGIAYSCMELLKAHLTKRTTGSIPMIQNQMIKGDFAEILVRLQTALSYYIYDDSEPSSFVSSRYVHEEVDNVMNILINLAGGHGFKSDSIGKYVYLSFAFLNILRWREVNE
ncbi:acyl-CoA dehydrogenase family protein [Bacillus sp. RO2]|uniref:hypothetical protein n=1 Tax=Bacillus sp. RO2 TaxID=2723913 RepID=UPI00145D6695|nr:hypothetical protein [Bacillus sp. RO2]NMH73535.1 acyl-CoA dehydrogenase family protein [Bacillus sp. RO2]